MTKIESDTAYLMRDIVENDQGMQSAWDHAADLRFAEYIGDTEAAQIIRECNRSQAPTPIILSVYDKAIGKLKRRRLRALRYLAKQKKLIQMWRGSYLWGVPKRLSVYLTIEKYNEFEARVSAAKKYRNEFLKI